MVTVLEKAVDEYRRAQFLRKANAAFARLRKDRKAWKEEQKERTAWDATLIDALEKDDACFIADAERSTYTSDMKARLISGSAPVGKGRRKSAKRSKRETRRMARNPVAPGSDYPQPLPHMRRLAEVPGVNAVLKRARTPYDRDPLSEEEALNLICDAREDEPAYPIEKLVKKYKR